MNRIAEIEARLAVDSMFGAAWRDDIRFLIDEVKMLRRQLNFSDTNLLKLAKERVQHVDELLNHIKVESCLELAEEQNKHLLVVKEKYDLLRKLLSEEVFFILLNANDTFAYACADVTSVESEDLDKLLEVYEKFGSSGMIAVQACIRKQEPLVQHRTTLYEEAKAYLKDWVPLF